MTSAVGTALLVMRSSSNDIVATCTVMQMQRGNANEASFGNNDCECGE